MSPTDPTPATRSAPNPGALLMRGFKLLASLKLTVVLFAMAIFIVLTGTLAQIDKGIWSVVEQYFRCSVAWIEFQLFFPRSWEVSGSFPFPGSPSMAPESWVIHGRLRKKKLTPAIMHGGFPLPQFKVQVFLPFLISLAPSSGQSW